MVFSCALEQTRYFNVEAESDEAMMEWLQTHSFQDVDDITKKYTDEYDERICECDSNGNLNLEPHFRIKNGEAVGIPLWPASDDIPSELLQKVKEWLDYWTYEYRIVKTGTCDPNSKYKYYVNVQESEMIPEEMYHIYLDKNGVMYNSNDDNIIDNGLSAYDYDKEELKWIKDFRAKWEPENVKENESMNEKMERLKALIDESNKIMDDVKAETKRLEEEHVGNRAEKFRAFCDNLKDYYELAQNAILSLNMSSTPFVKISGESDFEIRFEAGNDIGVQTDGRWIGRFDLRDTYGAANERVSVEYYYNNTRIYYLDDVVDEFDEAVFEENFTAMITEYISKQSKEIDAAYQDAKAKLEADNR